MSLKSQVFFANRAYRKAVLKLIRRTFLICTSFALWSCSSFLYYPTRVLYVDPQNLDPAPEEITFFVDLKFQQSLHGWLFRSKPSKKESNSLSKPKGVLVFFHGNGQNRSSHFRALHWILSYGYDFFIFDYPGYGRSPGAPSPANTVFAGEKAIEYIQSLYPQTPILIFAQSIGSVVALRALVELNQRDRICGVILESAFDSYKLAAREALSSSALTWLFQFLPYLVLSDEQTVRGRYQYLSPFPLMFIHQSRDKIIPIELGRHVYKASPEPKFFLELEGEGHVDALTREGSFQTRLKFLNFIDQHCKTQRFSDAE